jgi:hypothetical protein
MSALEEAYSGGPRTWNEAFPPDCIRTHWDPMAMSAYILPQGVQHNLTLDPRPSAKICTSYYNTSLGDAPLVQAREDRPEIPLALRGGVVRPAETFAFPSGGAARIGFPNDVYKMSIDAESDIFRLDDRLTKCAEKRYIPPSGLPVAATNELSGAESDIIKATVVKDMAFCREQDDADAWNRSARMFFNPTRYDRTTSVPANLPQAESRAALRK